MTMTSCQMCTTVSRVAVPREEMTFSFCCLVELPGFCILNLKKPFGFVLPSVCSTVPGIWQEGAWGAAWRKNLSPHQTFPCKGPLPQTLTYPGSLWFLCSGDPWVHSQFQPLSCGLGSTELLLWLWAVALSPPGLLGCRGGDVGRAREALSLCLLLLKNLLPCLCAEGCLRSVP